MKKQLIALGIIGILVAISFSGCLEENNKPTDNSEPEENEAQSPLSLIINLDKYDYNVGETINLTAILINNLNENVNISNINLEYGCFDLCIKTPTNLLIHYVGPILLIPTPQLVLAPGENITVLYEIKNITFGENNDTNIFKFTEKGVYSITARYAINGSLNFDYLESDTIYFILKTESGYKSYTFDVFEGYPSNEQAFPSLKLSMTTKTSYPCCNYNINTSLSIDFINKTIRVNILGIYKPEVCLTAFGPARAEIDLDITEGEYMLEFINGIVTDRYKLNISNISIIVTPLSSMLSEPEDYLYWRHPTNSFAYLCGTNLNTTWLCDDFLNVLLKNISLEEYTFPKGGKYPYSTSSMGHFYDMPAKYFLYKNESDFEKAGELLEAYSKNVLQNYFGSIQLINWKNEKHLSWLYE